MNENIMYLMAIYSVDFALFFFNWINAVKVYSQTFKFSKVVRQQIWGEMVDFILATCISL